jgi:RimJ/RimL family protein N-acetyltransferase
VQEVSLIFRPIHRSEVERLKPLLVADPASPLAGEQFQIRFDSGEYRPEWSWIAEAEPGGDAVALAIWWGTAREKLPAALDGLFVANTAGSQRAAGAEDRVGLAARLLAAGHEALAGAGLKRAPDFHMLLPPDWRNRPNVTAAVSWRLEAARRAGLTHMLERLRYEWTSTAGLPDARGLLTFRKEDDDDLFVELFSQVLTGTLDATSRREAAASGGRTQARQDVRFYRDHMTGERSWWRVAQTPAGEVAGFGIPSRNTEVPVVGYLGVVPEHRGHGYVDEILAEITRVLVAEAGAIKIRADTDLENRPMAAAFERAGYQSVGRRLVLSAS